MKLRKVISGGQTGADRAALNAAILVGIEHGGWCPRGRRAEDGPLDNVYKLKETASPLYSVRTRRNVMEADGTLLFSGDPDSPGCKLTRRVASAQGKPFLEILRWPWHEDRTSDLVAEWLDRYGVQVLNVAGNRESVTPGIYASVRTILEPIFRAALEDQ